MTDRNSLMADTMEKLAGCLRSGVNGQLHLEGTVQAITEQVEALRSTPERAEQPAGGLELYVFPSGENSVKRSPEAEAVIAAVRKFLSEEEYAIQPMADALDALDRKHRGVT
jgi:hypothetical protein